MGRYRPNMIDGVAGLALGGEASGGEPPPARAARALTAAGLAGQQARGGGTSGAALINEPEPATASIEDWIAYRRRVGPLAERDPGMRLALAVAEAQIAKLRRRMQAREDGAEN